MKLRLLLLNFLFFAFINALLAAPPTYIQTKDGVIVFTDPGFTRSSKAVKLEIFTVVDEFRKRKIAIDYNPFKQTV
jgi:alpha-D-xyloside xylohydrolase